MNALPSPPNYDVPEPPPPNLPRRWDWKRILAWSGAGLLILLVVLVIAVVVLLHSQKFHQYVLAKAQEKATAALGARVQARDFALSWSGISPSLDLYDVVVHGAAPYADPPLLQVDHLGVKVQVTSLLRRTWYLNDITVDHPVVRMLVDQHGTNNLPKPQSSGQKSQTNIFDLGVRHALLNRGEVYLNDRKTPLDADLHDLTFQSAFDAGPRQYSGAMSYRDGHLQFGTFNPVPHDLQAEFAANPSQFTLRHAVLRSGASQVTLDATVQDYSNPKVNAKYDATVDATQVRRIMKNSSLPAGMLRLAGSMEYQAQPNVPMLNTVKLDGNLSSGALRVETPSLRTEIRDIAARYSLDRGNAEVRDLRARILGGELVANMTMRDISGASQSRLRANLRGLSLAELKAIANSPGLKQVALGGTLNANADAKWGKSLNDLVANTDATLQATAGPANAAAGSANRVPLNGLIHARYAAASKQISLDQSYVRTARTSIILNGTVSNRSALQVRVQSADLHELETIAEMFRTPTPGQPEQPLGIYGTASFLGAVRGSTDAPQLTGQLAAANLRVKGSEWRTLRSDVNLSPSQASLQNGYLQPAGGGKVTFNLGAGLNHWSFTDRSPAQVKLNASQLNVADLAKATGSQTPVSGTLSANVSAHGSELNPIGQGTIDLTGARISGQPIQSANLNFQGTGDHVHANVQVKTPAGAAQGAVTYFPKQQGYEGQIQADGIQLGQLQAVKDRNLDLKGVLNLNASGRGTLKDPGLQATLQIPQLTVQNQVINGISLQAAVANHVANFALDSQALNTSIRGRGTVNLTGNYDANVTLDTQPIPLQPVLALYAPSQAPNITGQTELHATVRGPLKNKNLLDAHLTIPTLQVKYKDAIQIGAVSPIHMDFTNGVLALQRATIRGTDTDLQLQGSFPADKTQPVSLLLLGTVNLQLAQLFDPEIASSGQLRFNINSYGQRTDPNVEGQVEIVNANVATGSAPIGLQNGNGVLTLTKDRLNITKFQGTVGGGTVTAQGGVVYRPSLGFDLALAGRGIRMLYPDGVREGFDTNLALSGTTDSATLRGQVRLDQLSFTPDFDLTNFMGQFGGGTSPPPTQGFAQNLQLDISLQSTSGVNLVSRTLSLQAVANLRVSGTAAQPVLLGRVNLNGGDLIFNGNRYVLQGGIIDFVNPVETQPVVNVAVNTTIQQYNIHLRFDGPVDHLRTNYTSDPSLPPSDIINLLAFGKTTEAAAANPSPPGNAGAESLIASQVSSQVTSRVEKIAGISQLSVDPVLGNSQGQNPGARVTIQQRVTSNLFVTFATDVTSTQNQTIQLQYQLSPRVSISGTRDQNGGFGFDTRIKKTW